MPKPNTLWVPVDVNLLVDNRWDLSDQEIMAYLRLCAYAKVQDTDGIVPIRAAKRRAGEHIAALVEAQLISIGSRFVNVLDWLKWNDSREDREAKRSKWRERQRRHRKRTLSSTTETETETETGTNASRDALVTRLSRRDLPVSPYEDPEHLRWCEEQDRLDAERREGK